MSKPMFIGFGSGTLGYEVAHGTSWALELSSQPLMTVLISLGTLAKICPSQGTVVSVTRSSLFVTSSGALPVSAPSSAVDPLLPPSGAHSPPGSEPLDLVLNDAFSTR